MRELTVKQKKFLVQWANLNTDLMEKTGDYVMEMSYDDWEILKKINDTEILYSNVNRFLGDLEIKEHPITANIIYYEKK